MDKINQQLKNLSTFTMDFIILDLWIDISFKYGLKSIEKNQNSSKFTRNLTEFIKVYSKFDKFNQKWIKIHHFSTSPFNWSTNLSSDFKCHLKALEFDFELLTIPFRMANPWSSSFIYIGKVFIFRSKENKQAPSDIGVSD